jgi:putative transposase
MTIDGSGANAAALRSYNEVHGTTFLVQQMKYLNRLVEQDHRSVKRITGLMLGFKSFAAAQTALAGIERMQMLKKGQMVVVEGAEGLTAADQVYTDSVNSPQSVSTRNFATAPCLT